MKRREKRLWEENRKRILFEYVQFSYYSRSVRISLNFLPSKLALIIKIFQFNFGFSELDFDVRIIVANT